MLIVPATEQNAIYIIHFIHTTNMSWCDYYPVLYIKKLKEKLSDLHRLYSL